jgi:uncharacterized protein YjdB
MKKSLLLLLVGICMASVFVSCSDMFAEIDRQNAICTVTFNGNGGTPQMPSMQVTKGGVCGWLPGASLNGSSFSSWNTDKDGNGVQFTKTTTVSSDITVYAQWGDESFVRLDYSASYSDGVTINNTPSTTAKVRYHRNIFVIDTPVTISTAGKALLGYYTTKNSSGVKVASSDGLLIANVAGYTDEDCRWLKTEEDDASVVLYARWRDTSHITAITLQSTLSVPSSTSYTLTASYTPAYSTDTISWNGTNSDALIITSQSYSNGTATVTFMPRLPGEQSTLTCRASGGETASCGVTVTGPAVSSLAAMSSLSTVSSSNIGEYNMEHVTAGSVAFLRISLTAGKAYYFQYGYDLMSSAGYTPLYSYNTYLYDSSYTKLCSNTNGSGFSYTPTSTGTYVVAMKAYDGSTSETYCAVHVFSYTPVESLTLPSTLTIPSGDTVTLAALYTPAATQENITWKCNTSYFSGRIAIVSSDSGANGTANATITARLPGTSSIVVTSSLSGKSSTCNVTVTGPDLASLAEAPVGNEASTTASDYNVVYVSGREYQYRKVTLAAGSKYIIEWSDSLTGTGNILTSAGYSPVSDCYIYMFDSSYNLVASDDDSKYLSYTPTVSGTYVFLMTRFGFASDYSYCGFHIYESVPITSLVLDNTTVTVACGDTVTINGAYEPVVNNDTISWSGDSEYTHIQNTVSAGGASSAVIKGVLPGNTTIYCTTQANRISKSCSVRVTGPDVSALGEMTVGTAASTTATDYSIAHVNAGSVVYYKVAMDAGTTYHVEFANSYDSTYRTMLNSAGYSPLNYCALYLYNSSYNLVDDCGYYSSGFDYTPTVSGTYIVAMKAYSTSTYESYCGAHIYAQKPITAVTLDKTVITAESNKTFTVTATYTPADAVDTIYWDYWSGNIYKQSSTAASGGVSSATFISRLPGTGSVGCRSGIKNLYKYCTVTVTGPDVSALDEIIPGTSASTDINDWTVAHVSAGSVAYYKATLSGGTPYYIEFAHSQNLSSMLTSGGKTPVSYCGLYMYSTGYNQLSYTYEKGFSFTPASTGTYVFAMIADNPSQESYCGMHVYSYTPVTAITLDSSLALTRGSTATVTASYTPADTNDYITWSLSNSSYAAIVSSTPGTAGTASVVITGRYPGSETLTCKSALSGVTRQCTVTVSNPVVSSLAELTPGTAASTTTADYTVAHVKNGSAVFYKISLTAGTTYHFQFADSKSNSSMLASAGYTPVNNCYLYLYDSSFVSVGGCYSTGCTYTPTATGTYVVSMKAYSDSTYESWCGVHVYK